MHGCRKSQQLSLGSALRVQSIYYNYSTQPSFLIKRSWGHSQPPTIRAIPWDRKGKDWILKEASKIGRFSVLLRRNTQLLGSASITRSGPFIVIVSIPIRRVRFQIQRFFTYESALLRKLFQLLDAQNNLFPFTTTRWPLTPYTWLHVILTFAFHSCSWTD